MFKNYMMLINKTNDGLGFWINLGNRKTNSLSKVFLYPQKRDLLRYSNYNISVCLGFLINGSSLRDFQILRN